MTEGIAGSRPGRARAPRNAWYVIAFSDEVTSRPFARRILGDRIVLYRTAQGVPVALADYCAHRAMALSQGKLVGDDRLQCPYHGIEYDPSGACARVPSQHHVPRQMRVRSYPLVEKWRWIWGWMGDPAKADESLIPDHSLFGLAENDGFHKVARFVMHFDGSFQLLHENVLDVSHITFLHEGFFDSGKIAETKATTHLEERRIRITRHITEVVTGPYAKTFGFKEGTRVERELRSETWVPNLNVVTNVFTFPDEPNRTPVCRHAPFGITPATETSCHYFVAAASNYGEPLTGDALAAQNRVIWDVFLTDKAAIEAIQHSYDELGAATPDCSVRADEAAVRFRRILEKLLLAEEPANDQSVTEHAALLGSQRPQTQPPIS